MSQTTITSLGATRATSIAYDSTHGAIAIPQVSSADTFATLDATQTLTNKTLTTPTLTDGTRNLSMPTLTANDVLVSADATQTLTHKTITTPIIASLLQASNGGTINLPTVAASDSATLATTDDLSTADSALKGVLDNLIDYLAICPVVRNFTPCGYEGYLRYAGFRHHICTSLIYRSLTETAVLDRSVNPSGRQIGFSQGTANERMETRTIILDTFFLLLEEWQFRILPLVLQYFIVSVES